MSRQSDGYPDALRPEAVDGQSIHSSPTLLSSPLSGFSNRPGYQRLTTEQEEDTSYRNDRPDNISELPENDSVHGLRIRFSDHDDDALKIGATVTHPPTRQRSVSGSLLSPSSARSIKHGRNASLGSIPYDDVSSYGRSSPSSQSRLDEPFSINSEEELLHVKRSASTLRSYDNSGLQEGEPRCKTTSHFHHSRGTWLSITILILSVYSTILSGIWLGIALARPRYGRYVTDKGNLPPSTASLLCAAFAKTIELSFVTVFVTFLGQVLSQRAFVKQSRGMTISEMQMRSWIMQPGTMITHWETVRYAAWSFLGVIALITSLAAMIYTTASDGLVAPKLKFGPLEERKMYGSVSAIFGFEANIEANCKTPIDNTTDPDHYGQTCIAIEHSGQGYHNYAQWLTNWEDSVKDKQGSTDQAHRPPPVGMIYDNTTITGSWIETQNMTEVSKKYNRVVNNVTMAMPLTAVFAAARHPINNVLQPQDLNGLGEYYLEASVPSPATNVLCARLSTEELAPMVVELWPGFNGTRANNTNYPAGFDIPKYPDWLNETKLDDVFGFGEKYGRRMPVFPKVPLPFNTVTNTTAVTDEFRTDSMYLLGTSEDGSHMMCSLRTYLSPNCSTRYHASMSGGDMTAHCNDRHNELAYSKSHPEAPSGVYLTDWINVANQWAITMSLGAGISDDDASNARLLTQLIPTQDTLSPTLPSTAEALAVLVGCTLLLSGIDAPLIHYWNHSITERFLSPPELQSFDGTLRFQDYSSGASQRWQGMFYVILFLVFFTNLFCLGYFIFHKGLVTDFIEPQNLFSLAINSPHSHVLEGSCGGGPERNQLKTNWHIRLDPARDHFYIESLDEPPEVKNWRRRRGPSSGSGWRRRIMRRGSSGNAYEQNGYNEDRAPEEMHMHTSPVATMFNKFSSKRRSLL